MSLKDRKGQYLIVEQMVVFSIGVFIALAFITMFGTFEEGVREETSTNQLKTYSKTVTNKILSLVETDTEGTAVFEIPKKLGGKSYLINLSEGLIIQAGNYEYKSDLVGLNEHLNLSGLVLSNKGKAKLSYDGDEKLTISGA